MASFSLLLLLLSGILFPSGVVNVAECRDLGANIQQLTEELQQKLRGGGEEDKGGREGEAESRKTSWMDIDGMEDEDDNANNGKQAWMSNGVLQQPEIVPEMPPPSNVEENKQQQDNNGQTALGFAAAQQKRPDWRGMKNGADGMVSVPIQLAHDNIDSTMQQFLVAAFQEVQAKTCIRFVDTKVDASVLGASNQNRIWLANGQLLGQANCQIDTPSMGTASPLMYLVPECMEQPFRFLQVLSICLGIPEAQVARLASTAEDIFRWLNKMFQCTEHIVERPEPAAVRYERRRQELEKKRHQLEKALEQHSPQEHMNMFGQNQREWAQRRLETVQKRLQHLRKEYEPLSFTIYPTEEELRRNGINRAQAHIASPVRIWNIYRNRRERKYIVPYYIHEMSANARLQIKWALREIEEHTCLQFRVFDPLMVVVNKLHYNTPAIFSKKTSAIGDNDDSIWQFRDQSTQYIQYRRGDDGCYSQVGRQEFGQGQHKLFGGVPFYYQDIVLTDWCSTNLITLVHETFHALGLFHFHSANNRDLYLHVIEENLTPEGKFQFEKFSFFRLLPRHIRPESIMVYPSQNDFGTKPGVCTITTKDGQPIKMAETVPDTDWEVVNTLYQCHRAWDNDGEGAGGDMEYWDEEGNEPAKIVARAERKERLKQLRRRLNANGKKPQKGGNDGIGSNGTITKEKEATGSELTAENNNKLFKELVKRVLTEVRREMTGGTAATKQKG